MSKRWISSHTQAFARDIMRDFCMCCAILEEQCQSFSLRQKISFSVLDELLGSTMNKGQLWRLKDTAHHLFSNDADAPSCAPAIDWTIGYIFHECLKLREDAYQHSRYSKLYDEIMRMANKEGQNACYAPLADVLSQTTESISRELQRISFLLRQLRSFLCIYYQIHGNNKLLARLLHDNDVLVRIVFGSSYTKLLSSIYKERPQDLYIQAADSLLEGGRYADALCAANKALTFDPNCSIAQNLQMQARHHLYNTPAPRRETT